MSHIHETAIVSSDATLGEGVSIWHHTVVRENVKIGDNCVIGGNVYLDEGVVIGNNVKIQNNACVYRKAIIEDGVFIGPGAMIINDKVPRAVTPDGKLKDADEWECGTVTVKRGAAIGAGSIILPDITIGERAMTGAGAVVTKDVADKMLVVGNPAKEHGNAPDA
jgi:UDP-2-acetamido-3-amino-2,3-dideoxy-glucuronate N-acetyltransferase